MWYQERICPSRVNLLKVSRDQPTTKGQVFMLGEICARMLSMADKSFNSTLLSQIDT